MVRVSQRRALGTLFLVLSVAFAALAIAAARDGVWVVTFAAAVLGLWLFTMAVRGLRPR
jgi:succinate-acetate transporter protein